MVKLGAWLMIVWLLLVELIWPPAALAHAGAPYPLLVDEPVGPYRVSTLADPDVGQGTFYIEAKAADGSLPAGTTVTVAVQPADGHLAEAGVPAERRSTRYGDRYVATVPFDTEGLWQVRLLLDGPAGRAEHRFSVDVTPPGISWLGTVACLLPFLLLGGLWVRSALRKRSMAHG
jgi:hypothetical protein